MIFTKEIIQSGSSTTAPEVGFINDDSLPDIVLSYSTFDRSSVFFNNGNFNFPELVLENNFNYETPVMNLDNQGTEDVALVNYATNKIALFKYVGNDQFELQSNFYATGTYGIASFLVDDFNQDGFDDFAITRCNWYDCTDSIYIYFNNKNWSFYLNQILYIGELNWYKSNSADLNGDSFPDIFMKGCNGSNILTLLWNDGNGNFSFENPVDIYEHNDNELSLRIFPNPFSNRLMIKIDLKIKEGFSLAISNIYGSTVKTFTNPDSGFNYSQMLTWDGYNENKVLCPAGIYIISVSSGSIQFSKKVIKY